MESLLAGDSWELFIERYSGFVAAIVRRLLLSHTRAGNADVEDVIENVFLSLMENDCRLLRRYDANHKLSTYLGVIARTQVHRWLRSRKSVVSLGEEAGAILPDEKQAGVQEGLQRGEARDAVRRAMVALGERDRKVLELFYYKNASYQDIAERLGVKMNSVGALLTRARARLQSELARVTDLSESDYRAL